MMMGLRLSIEAWTQQPWEVRRHTLVATDTALSDTLFILPGSIIVHSKEGILPDSCILLQQGGYVLSLRRGCRLQENDSLWVEYRTLPISARPYQLKDHRLISRDTAFFPDLQLFYFPPSRAERNLWGDLNKNGSISRGITVGNTQDLAVNSALNLQLDGRLAQDVHVRAVITDENIPLQPDGTQQNLQDFDKVFVEVWKDRHKAVAGDFFVTRPRGYFLNIFKRAQGLQLNTALDNKEILGNKAPKGEMRALVSGAIARGRFARNQFFGTEGKQGPYPLRGADNETFIVVLSGTERVFIDGVLLKRGQEHDYVIDYNLAQITFTARQLITKDRRIVVEFEYSDRNYVRTHYQIHHEWDIGKWGWRFNVFSEQDSRNQPLQQPLSPAQRELLSQIGNNLNLAVSPSAVPVDFSPGEVLYAKKDTLINGEVDTIFVYSTDPARARWRVTFTHVGAGQGDYMPEVSTANGRVFRFVGKNQGEFNPVVRLITPKLQRMITAGTTFRPLRNVELDAEAALSTRDLNLFSQADQKNNTAPAFRIQASGNAKRPLGKDSLKQGVDFRWRVWHEFVHENFVPFVRFRNVEFGRDWNLSTPIFMPQGSEHLPGGALEFMKEGHWRMAFETQGFFKGSDYAAWRQILSISTEKSKVSYARTWISITPMRLGVYRSLFARHRTAIRKSFGKFVALEFIGEDEYNTLKHSTSRLIQPGAYVFSDWQAALSAPDSLKKFTWRLFYRIRNDWRPDSLAMRYTSAGHNSGVRWSWQPRLTQRLALTVEHRLLRVKRQTLIPEKPDQALVTRLEYYGRLWHNNLTLNVFYETGSGFEVRRTLAYIPVNNGQGTHFWDLSLDYNGNGVADLDEFQPALLPGQGNYMRVLINTGEFVRTFNNQFNGNFFLRMPSDWKNKKGLKRFAARWSAQGTLSVDRKTQTQQLSRAYNPFFNALSDTGLIAFNTSWRAGLFFNRNEGLFGWDFNYRESSTRVLLSNGPEARSQTVFVTTLRLNLGRRWTLNTEGETGRRRSDIPFLPSRNYTIRHLSISQKITFQYDTKWRLLWMYTAAVKNTSGQATTDVASVQHNTGPELTWNFKARGTVTVRIQYINIHASGPVQGPLAFDLFEALAPGSNGAVSLNGQYALGKNLQLSFTYEGRFGRFRPVHNGSVQVRAFF
jgi:hypothetical protein